MELGVTFTNFDGLNTFSYVVGENLCEVAPVARGEDSADLVVYCSHDVYREIKQESPPQPA